MQEKTERFTQYINHYQTLSKDQATGEQINRCVDAISLEVRSNEPSVLTTYWMFIKGQWHFIEKKWWLFQGILLFLTSLYLTSSSFTHTDEKKLGIMGTLFIILMIPELWKNQSTHSTEIEQTTYFTLKQIYAARMILFLWVDITFIMVFCAFVTLSVQMTYLSLIINFLFPMIVTAIICFSILSRYEKMNESIAIMFCVVWNGLWTFCVTTLPIYESISPIIGVILFLIAILGLVVVVKNTLKRANDLREV